MSKKKLNIANLSNFENELIRNAGKDYGSVYNNSHNLIGFVWSFISKVDDISYLFVLFLTQVRKDLTLSLLSIVRKHVVQANMMLRHALESSCLACYGLANPSQEDFLEIDERTGIIQENKILDRAYKWIETEHRDYSDRIKYAKGVINKLYAHAFILQPAFNFSVSRSGMTSSFHDSIDEILTKSYLWNVADIAFNLLDLFSKVIQKYPSVVLVSDFEERMKEFYIENEKIKTELMRNPRFAKWLDSIRNSKKLD